MKVILGNGLSAKIFAFYNPEYFIIGEENKFAENNITNNLLFLQKNQYNLSFLKDLMYRTNKIIDFHIDNMNIIYQDKSQYTDSISEEYKKELINKKLKDIKTNEQLTYEHPLFKENIVLSEEKNNILSFINVNFSELLFLLNSTIEKQILSNKKITSINLKNKEIILEDNKIVLYSECVSTLPFNIFCNLAKVSYNKEEYKTLNTSIRKTTEEELKINKIPYNDAIVYYAGKEEFSKIVKRNGVCYAEYTGNIENSEICRNTRLIRKPILEFENVVFLGRYAQWNPDIKIQDVIKFSSNKNNMQKIWENQKNFSKNYFDFKLELPILQKNIKEIILLISEKSFELLNQINWKPHLAKDKKINISKIKEIWIDIFKYWLTIGINLGISYEDFCDIYWERAEKIKNKNFGEKNESKINNMDK